MHSAAASADWGHEAPCYRLRLPTDARTLGECGSQAVRGGWGTELTGGMQCISCFWGWVCSSGCPWRLMRCGLQAAPGGWVNTAPGLRWKAAGMQPPGGLGRQLMCCLEVTSGMRLKSCRRGSGNAA
ncbi:hypothetical protein NDU88_001454 [Pleurodeles waltl]|uniref:Uncharacterized protein n=1 Tax=Pleurodeles waltl TaxID=8319 RepID=A0AAV7LYM3_PLEWA|nr:hypothetical protein NDU88_001454 [Pleurodeles waltl]